MRKINYPCVVTIAGSDPSGGAGIQADIKAISATGCYAASIITALVAQNTQGVQAIAEVPASFVNEQITSVFSDLTISAVKIGMLHNERIIRTVSEALHKLRPHNIVLDPVMVSKNGSALLLPHTIQLLKDQLLPLATLITPNLSEAEKLLGETLTTTKHMASAAERLAKTYHTNVLIKGGHLNNLQASDVLYSIADEKHSWFRAERINTKNTHGTGCSLSAAIASFLALNHSLPEAISKAKSYLSKAILAGQSLQIGHGHGPVDHFYFLRENNFL